MIVKLLSDSYIAWSGVFLGMRMENFSWQVDVFKGDVDNALSVGLERTW